MDSLVINQTMTRRLIKELGPSKPMVHYAQHGNIGIKTSPFVYKLNNGLILEDSIKDGNQIS